MAIIPSYELYGEQGEHLPPDVLHCESIALRSRAHAGVIRPHRHHGLFQLLITRQGRIQAVIENKPYRLDGSFLILMPPMAIHAYEIDYSTEGWVLTFPTSSLQSVFAAIPGLRQLLEAPLVLSAQEAGPGFAQLERQLESTQQEFRCVHPGRQYVLQAALDILMISLSRIAAVTNVADVAGINLHNRKADKVGRFLALIEHYYREHLTAAAYAEKLGVTATHLNRLCKEVAGRNTSQLIHDRLLMEAQRNLVYTAMSVTEIARILGYVDTAYFSRFFYHKVGMSPLNYRRRKQLGLVRDTPAISV